ncbi:hypothetical protein ACFCYN_24990 [Gottfriedia sp. NPDC056225]|uniref:hypothetical protein n=1 Tax=Gottfriedia sp. NPDC056225 TaxID=3345751 RepID=UPI0035D83615
MAINSYEIDYSLINYQPPDYWEKHIKQNQKIPQILKTRVIERVFSFFKGSFLLNFTALYLNKKSCTYAACDLQPSLSVSSSRNE